MIFITSRGFFTYDPIKDPGFSSLNPRVTHYHFFTFPSFRLYTILEHHSLSFNLIESYFGNFWLKQLWNTWALDQNGGIGLWHVWNRVSYRSWWTAPPLKSSTWREVCDKGTRYPPLYTLIMEGLSLALSKAKENGSFPGINIRNDNINISFLFFCRWCCFLWRMEPRQCY